MKSIPMMIESGCAALAACVVLIGPAPAAAASCEPLKARLDQATALEAIYRKNAANRRKLHNEVYQRKKIADSLFAECSPPPPGWEDWCGSEADHNKIREELLSKIEPQLASVQADLDEVSGKLEETVKEIEYVRGEIGKCQEREKASQEAAHDATHKHNKTPRRKSTTRQQIERARVRSQEAAAAEAAAAAATINTIIGIIGSRGGSRGPGGPPRGAPSGGGISGHGH
jgi:hypothetical protein